jgi:hypothetical protein
MFLLGNCMFPVNFILDEEEYYVQLCTFNRFNSYIMI